MCIAFYESQLEMVYLLLSHLAAVFSQGVVGRLGEASMRGLKSAKITNLNPPVNFAPFSLDVQDAQHQESVANHWARLERLRWKLTGPTALNPEPKILN